MRPRIRRTIEVLLAGLPLLGLPALLLLRPGLSAGSMELLAFAGLVVLALVLIGTGELVERALLAARRVRPRGPRPI